MSTLEEVTWNLDDLLEDGTESDPEAAVVALLDEADKAAGKFSADYEGKVAEISGQDLIVAMTRLADISDRAGRALNYAHLRFAAEDLDGRVLPPGERRTGPSSRRSWSPTEARSRSA